MARRFCASRRGERRSPQGRTPFGPTCWLRLCRAVGLVFIFFACSEDFPRSSLGPGWLELPIVDCRLSIADAHWKELQHHFFNRQSAISNRQLKPGLRLRPKAALYDQSRLKASQCSGNPQRRSVSMRKKVEANQPCKDTIVSWKPGLRIGLGSVGQESDRARFLDVAVVSEGRGCGRGKARRADPTLRDSQGRHRI